MPFTLAHAAAAIPFRRTRLITSAVVVGCFAPDFMFYLTLRPRHRFGHTWTGAFVLDLPLSLLILWLFHRYAKEPLWHWMPKSFRQRVTLGPRALPVKNLGDFALLLVSILVGIGTHMLWDSFTHPDYWPYRHWSLLRDSIVLPIVGSVECYTFFQYASSVIGTLVILVWFLRLPKTGTSSPPQTTQTSGINNQGLFVASLIVAIAAGILRASIRRHDIELFVSESVVTTISVFWFELVIYGILRAKNTTGMQSAT
jgi:Domain of unknown function (DUF4184)